MILGTNISKSFTDDTLFEHIDFKISNNRKISLVGKNGCGKSTLFNIITKNIIPDEGDIRVDNETIGYLPQEIEFPDQRVGPYIEEHLENSWEFYKVERLLDELQFMNFNPEQELSTLSEGQKMKIQLLLLLLENPTTLLIDEPTNHLDIEGILWFEEYVRSLDKNVLMISHDREFLNNTVDEIWEIDNKKLFVFIGDYDNYKEEKLKLINKWNEEYVRFLKKKAQLEALLHRARTKKISRKGGTGQVKSRIKREVEGNKKEEYTENKMKHLQFETGVTHAKRMIQFDQVSKKYGDNTVFEDLSFEIRGGEKVWLFGPNGGGKTTIFKLIGQEIAPSAGHIKTGENITVGFFSQKQTHLDYDKSVFDCFIDLTSCSLGKAYGKLKQFMFENDDLKKRVKNLSPGQRARLAFAVFAYNDYDMLILDEPDNHLDIDTKEVLEEALNTYKGTLLLISHDRFFVERAGVTKVLNLRDGRLNQF